MAGTRMAWWHTIQYWCDATRPLQSCDGGDLVTPMIGTKFFVHAIEMQNNARKRYGDDGTAHPIHGESGPTPLV